MAIYVYACAKDGEVELDFPMGKAPCETECPECYARAVRVFTVPQFQQDNLRLWRSNVDGGRYSYALGQEMPQSRSELNRICEAKGIEFVSKSNMPQEWKDNLAYKEHVDNGGQREEAPKPDISKAPKVRDLMREAKAL